MVHISCAICECICYKTVMYVFAARSRLFLNASAALPTNSGPCSMCIVQRPNNSPKNWAYYTGYEWRHIRVNNNHNKLLTYFLNEWVITYRHMESKEHNVIDEKHPCHLVSDLHWSFFFLTVPNNFANAEFVDDTNAHHCVTWANKNPFRV